MKVRGRTEAGLEERLERLKGASGVCCVADYREMARDVRRSPKFGSGLSTVRALADENRLLAASLLRRRGELCACEIQAATGLDHATVSHHMAILVAAGVARGRRKGKWMYYRLSDGAEAVVP